MNSRVWALLCALAAWFCFAQNTAQAQPTSSPADKVVVAKQAADKATGDKVTADGEVARIAKLLDDAKSKAKLAEDEVTRTTGELATAKKALVEDAITRLKDLRDRKAALKSERMDDPALKNFDRNIEAVCLEITENGGTVPPEPVVEPTLKADLPTKKIDPPTVALKPTVETKAAYEGAPMFAKKGSGGEFEPLKTKKSWQVVNGYEVNVIWAEETGSKHWYEEKQGRLLDGKYYPKGTYYSFNFRTYQWFAGNSDWTAGWYEFSGEDAAKAPAGTLVSYSGSCPVAAPSNVRYTSYTTGGSASSGAAPVCVPCQATGGQVATTTGWTTSMAHPRPRILERILHPVQNQNGGGQGSTICIQGVGCVTVP